MKTRKIWLGLSAAALSTAVSTPPHAAVSTAAVEAAQSGRSGALAAPVRVAQGHTHSAKSDGGEGDENGGAPAKAPAKARGEGGEGGEGGENAGAKADADAKLDPMVRFYRDIELVRGHLLVGGELVDAGLWADALPHFLHPSEELYGPIAGHLQVLKMPAFEKQLKALVQTVKAKNKEAYLKARAAVDAKLAAIDGGMRKEQKDWTAFAAKVALEAMRSAIGEYEESIEGGKFVKAVEYQDSRGFVFEADRLLQSVAADLKARFPDDAAKAFAAVADLKKAWPTPVPPASPVMDVGGVLAGVSKVELALGNVK